MRWCVRTTLTIDEDVAVEIERLRRSRGATLKGVVNEALRLGLQQMQTPVRVKPFRTKTFDMGAPLIDIDNVAQALAYSEGEDFK
jgi:hypothetical protein